jgi:hypothetical protein
MDLDSESKSESDLEYDLDQDPFGLSESEEPLELSKPSVSELLLEIPTPCPKHSIRARIQAVTFL